MNKDLKLLLKKNFDTIFDDIDLFIAGIPAMAKMIGVEEFIEKMKFTKPQYYRRIERPEQLWTIAELKRAKKIFKDYSLGIGNR